MAIERRQPLPWREAFAGADEVVVPPDECWEAHAGLELFEMTPERVSGRIPAVDAVKQPMGIVHGGVLASLAETLASWGTAAAVRADGCVAVGLTNATSFFRPLTSGHVNAEASGGTPWRSPG